MSRSTLRAVLAASIACVWLTMAPTTGRAQSWFESGDAGDLRASAQMTIGAGQLLQITGQLRDANDVDLFCIRILDPATFVAELDCAVQSDPDLWLFSRAVANGVSHQDVCHSGDKRVTGEFIRAAGMYYLAIACDGREAMGPSGAIWSPVLSSMQRQPDGPGAPGPLLGWSGTGASSPLMRYTIHLTGAAFVDAPATMEGVSWGRIKVLYHD